jgi:hypothetical protein
MSDRATWTTDDYLADFRRERRIESWLDRGSWVVSLSCFGTVIFSTIIAGRLDPFFVFVTLLGIVSRLSTLVLAKAFDVPRLLEDFDRSPAARAALDTQRTEVLRRFLVEQRESSDDEAIGQLDDARLAELRDGARGPQWRVIGRRFGLVFAPVFVFAVVNSIRLLLSPDFTLFRG